MALLLLLLYCHRVIFGEHALDHFRGWRQAAGAPVLLLGQGLNPAQRPRRPEPIASLKFNQLPSDNKLPADLLMPAKEPFPARQRDKFDIEILQIGGTTRELFSDAGRQPLLQYSSCRPGDRSHSARTEVTTGGGFAGILSGSPEFPSFSGKFASQKVWVLGRVNTPGSTPSTSNDRAGSHRARRRTIHLSFFRNDGGTGRPSVTVSWCATESFFPVDFYKLLRNGDLSQNIYLRDGDYIYLPPRSQRRSTCWGGQAADCRRVCRSSDPGQRDRQRKRSASAAYRQRIVIIRGSLAEAG